MKTCMLDFLINTAKLLKKINRDLSVDKFVDDTYIRRAAKEYGYDYDARLKDYSPVPFTSKDFVTGQAVTDPKRAGEIWVAGEKKVRLYKDIPSTFAALDQLKKEGKTVRVTFVHDRDSGSKLFADKVWYVRNGNDVAAFLEKDKAAQWAKANGGKVQAYAEARNLPLGSKQAAAQ